MISTDEIVKFLKELSGSEEINESSDIFEDVGMVGDDFHEMIEKFSTHFSVDMTEYIWYFHTDEEGLNFGGLFFKPPYGLVDRIPITPSMLKDFANKGKWDIAYPIHKIPSKRPDLFINKILVVASAAVIIIMLIRKYFI